MVVRAGEGVKAGEGMGAGVVTAVVVVVVLVQGVPRQIFFFREQVL